MELKYQSTHIITMKHAKQVNIKYNVHPIFKSSSYTRTKIKTKYTNEIQLQQEKYKKDYNQRRHTSEPPPGTLKEQYPINQNNKQRTRRQRKQSNIKNSSIQLKNNIQQNIRSR